MQVQTENNKVTPQQIKVIHTLKSRLGISDEVYRSILRDWHVYSSTQLTAEGADQLIHFLRHAAEREGKWIQPRKKYAHLAGRYGMATPKQLRMIEAMWSGVSRASKPAERAYALCSFLERFGINRLEDLEFHQVHKVVRTLQAMKAGGEQA